MILAAAVSAFSQTLPQGVEKKATVGGITEYDYSNGLRVLLFPDPSSPKVTVNMTYLVGSRFEGYGETGMAHLLEHMNFILTTDGRSIKKELTDHGAQWNGTTDYDRTNYFETVTASDENLKWALGLEAERMVKMRIEKPLLDTEMTVVRNEFERGENNPQEILEERVVATAYLWHNYGKSVIGSRADIEKVPIDKLAAFYRKYYQPDNAVLVIAGQFDQSKALAYVAETCGPFQGPRANWTNLTRWNRPRMASDTSHCAGWGKIQPSPSAGTRRRCRSRIPRLWRCWTACWPAAGAGARDGFTTRWWTTRRLSR